MAREVGGRRRPKVESSPTPIHKCRLFHIIVLASSSDSRRLKKFCAGGAAQGEMKKAVQTKGTNTTPRARWMEVQAEGGGKE